jgi:uncharacterized protein
VISLEAPGEAGPMTIGATQDERSRFRVLSLDGGGVRGAFTASVLAELEQRTGTRCAERFDLIAGTSTGGLLAIALAMGHPADRLFAFYRDRGASIFPFERRLGRFRGALRQLRTTKYAPTALRDALTDLLGASTLGEAHTRLVIPAYDITTGRVFVFKTRHLPRFEYDVDVPAVDIALCTSAAPTYFRANLLAQHAKVAYIDGGVWANTPAMVGIVEAVGFLGRGLDEIDVLSVGTTSPVPDFSNQVQSGAIAWGKGMVDLFMTAQTQGSVAMAQVLCGSRFHRINMTVPDEWTTMDTVRRVHELIGAGQAEARKKANHEVVRERFLNDTPIERFVDAGG